MTKKIAITIGDPAGIGPEIIVKALNELCNINSNSENEFLLIGCKSIFDDVSLGLGINIPNVEYIDVPCNKSEIVIGQVSPESGRVSYKALEMACKLVNKGKVKAIVTAPLSKHAINLAGYHYSGQTEIIEKLLGSLKNTAISQATLELSGNIKLEVDKLQTYKDIIGNRAEMLFVSNDLRILLLTRHISISTVSTSITLNKVVESVIILSESLKNDFGISDPKIAMCGLNPHAGEAGLIGQEEEKIIIPAIKYLNELGINVDGPFPADTLWVKSAKAFLNNQPQPYDSYIACYHDQGLIPIKMLAMDRTVNTTINLPVIRTSPAHGTAFDIAGKYTANFHSMLEAIRLAQKF